MIITRAPFRISFCGGGSDIPYFYKEHGPGAVVSTSINKYMYCSAHPLFFNDGYLLKYSEIENCSDVNKINHKIIKEVFKDFGIKGIDFNSSADIPAGTGLSSSSAFTCAIIQLCSALTERYLKKEEIAEMAFNIEANKLGAPIGKQDQYASAFGGLNYIEFGRNGHVIVEKLFISKFGLERLQNNLKLFYVGMPRDTNKVLSKQKDEVKKDINKIKQLRDMVILAKELKDELLQNNIDAMGDYLHRNWLLKQQLNGDSKNDLINEIYLEGLNAGASGGKLLGAGGGGFMLFYIKEQYHKSVKTKLQKYSELEFKFDFKGTQTIFYD